jgi:hypothetical protein
MAVEEVARVEHVKEVKLCVDRDGHCRLLCLLLSLVAGIMKYNWSERSACAALGHCFGTKCPLYLLFGNLGLPPSPSLGDPFLVFFFLCA